jgi:hypothetical protein
MPGLYAATMATQQAQGRYPTALLSVMLYGPDLDSLAALALYPTIYDTVMHLGTVASCHPDAGKFMNIISNANYPGDLPANRAMLTGGAATAAAGVAALAALQDLQAIWIKYGSSEEHSHSTMLFTGTNNTVEHFEAWALDGGGYPIHLSICEEPDELGEDRTYGRSTRAEAQLAINRLVSADVNERRLGWDRLSRSGRDYAPSADEQVHINIHVEQQKGIGAFQNLVAARLRQAGSVRARAVEQIRNVYVCCHCQYETWYWISAYGRGWRKCGAAGCSRKYCSSCRRLLVNNTCHCGQATVWI